MKWPESPLVQGIFIERLHRFGALVLVEKRQEYCHVPNSGRLRELLKPGARVALVDHLVAPRAKTTKAKPSPRKTRYSIRSAKYRGAWVCIEANIAPRLFREGWEQGLIPWSKDFERIRSEVPLDRHTRFDFLATGPSGLKAWIEVKCVTLVHGEGSGYFPDAPSERAVKHLRELIRLRKGSKDRCYVVFILQNPAGRSIRPNEGTDPEFAAALREAFRKGVVLKAYRAGIRLEKAWLVDEIPVIL